MRQIYVSFHYHFEEHCIVILTQLFFNFSYRWLECPHPPDSLSRHIYNATLVVLPNNDDGPRPSTSLLGLPPGRQREQEEAILPHVQCLQAWEVPSLLRLQPLRPKHGPPLPLDQQLRGLLESQVLPAAADLRADHLLHNCHFHGIRLLQSGRLGLQQPVHCQKQRESEQQHSNHAGLHDGLHRLRAHDRIPALPLEAGSSKQDHDWKSGQAGQAIQEHLWYRTEWELEANIWSEPLAIPISNFLRKWQA